MRSPAERIEEAILGSNRDLRAAVCNFARSCSSDSPLIQSVVMNFSTDGTAPGRQFILSTPKCPEVWEVRSDLLVASKTIRAPFPEFEAWTEDSETAASISGLPDERGQ
jgi:hypothetical protein